MTPNYRHETSKLYCSGRSPNDRRMIAERTSKIRRSGKLFGNSYVGSYVVLINKNRNSQRTVTAPLGTSSTYYLTTFPSPYHTYPQGKLLYHTIQYHTIQYKVRCFNPLVLLEAAVPQKLTHRIGEKPKNPRTTWFERLPNKTRNVPTAVPNSPSVWSYPWGSLYACRVPVFIEN